MTRKKRQPSTIESWSMLNGKTGDHFYSEKMDRHLTAIATYYSRKIKTERLVLVSMDRETPVARSLTKVTLL